MVHSRKISLKKDKEHTVLRNNNAIHFKINRNELDINGRHRLFFSCEDSSYPALKNESGAELLYMLTDDSLNYEKAEKNRYCLDMSCEKPLPFAKRAVKKVVWQPLIYGLYPYDDFGEYENEWFYGIRAKADNLKIDGYLHMRADIWYVRDGVDASDTTLTPDETHIINIPEGTYGYRMLKESLNLEKDKTACVIITVEGENYSGNVYLETPMLSDKYSRNMLPEFEKGNIGLTRFAWLGQNLSKREWPRVEITVNGSTVFDGEIFLKVHRFSPVEVILPKNCFNMKENTISIKYKSDYLDTIPLLLDEILLLEKENREFALIRCPQEVAFNENISLLIEKNSANVQIEFESNDFDINETTDFNEFSLSVISIKSTKEKNNLKFKIKSGSYEKEYTVKRCIRKKADNVIAGSGDMIYVNVSDTASVVDYIKWYVANDIGNLVTVRTVYRWGGQRFANERVWKTFKKLCEKLGLHYVHLSDGRDIPGIAANPSEKMLDGNNFLGRQLHERDGQLFYWPIPPREIQAPLEEFFDLAARLGREYPETVEGSCRPFNIEYGKNGYAYRREVPELADMEQAHNIAAKELSDLSKDNYTRHTGPSVMFKYFYQNGFKWTGAETMDGSTEILLSFMRGASKAFKTDKTGVHLALQWGNYPHNTEQRYKRYLLSLYIPYMHGVTDINTEEGLWFIESWFDYYNRISDVCERHREQLNKFNRFLRTHSRTGKFHTPIAFLHGRYDGWNGFDSDNMWGMHTMKYGDEADSWKMLKSFYPLDSIETKGCEKTGYIPAETDKPFGIFSGTPMGCVDVVPIENGDFSDYSVLVFAGYNKAEKEDLDRIYDFVSDGGNLICTWSHLSDTTLKNDIDNYNLNIVNHRLVSYICTGTPEFTKDYAEGREIIVCNNVTNNCNVFKTAESGIPLIYSVKCGKGKITVINTLYYPGNESIFNIYQNTIEKICKDVLEKESIVVKCGTDVEYTVYKQENDIKHYYFTAVDWYNDSKKPRSVGLEFDGYSYTISIKYGDIVKIVTNGKSAVYPKCDSCEVVELYDNSFIAQGYGEQSFYCLQNGIEKNISVDFGDEPIKRINI